GRNPGVWQTSVAFDFSDSDPVAALAGGEGIGGAGDGVWRGVSEVQGRDLVLTNMSARTHCGQSQFLNRQNAAHRGRSSTENLMRPRRICMHFAVSFLLLACSFMAAQTMSPEVRGFVKADAPVVALTHIRVIDGTGAAAREDQTVVISNGKIESVGDA